MIKILFSKIICPALFICLIGVAISYSQIPQHTTSLKVRHLGIRDGLSSNSIWSIFQDSKGFIWIGTMAGLDKYDGYSFKKFLSDTGGSVGFLDHGTDFISEDKLGIIWAVRGTLVSIEPKKGKETWYYHDEKNPGSIGKGDISSTFVDSKGRLWIGFVSGELDLFDRSTKTFKHFDSLCDNSEYNSYEGISSILERDDGCLIVRHNGYWHPTIFNPERGAFLDAPEITIKGGDGYFLEVSTDDFYKKSISIYNDTVNKTIILFEGDPFNLMSKQIVIPQDRFSFINMWKNKKLLYRGDEKYWFPTEGSGLLEIDFGSGYVGPINVIDAAKLPIRIGNVLRSNEGAVWMISMVGLYIADELQNSFRTYTLHNELKKEVQFSVRSLFFDNKNILWAGTRPGSLFRYDPTISEFREAPQFPERSNYPKPAAINHIVQDKNSRIWVTCRGGTLYCSEPPFTKLVRRFDKPTSYNGEINGSTWGAIVDSEGILWAAYMSYDRKIQSALVRIDPNSNKINRYYYTTHSEEDQGFIPNMLERDKNSLWVGTDRGLFIFDKRTGVFGKNFSHQKGNAKSISAGSVWVLFKDHKNRLWLATEADGLNLLNEKDETFTHYRKDDGLPSNSINSILEDSLGNLWLGTLNGISCFNPDHGTFTNYTSDDGILDDIFCTNSVTISHSGEFFFGGVQGVSSFFPGNVHKRVNKSSLYFTNFKVSDSSLYDEISNGDTIRLTYEDNYFSLDASYLDFSHPSKKRYEYMLEGYDAKWINADQRRSISYNNVGPGSYILRLRVYIDGNTEIQNEIYATIIITPPFWRTWWFETGVGILAILAVGFIISSWRKKRIEIQNQLEDARESERVNLASELHDGPLQDLYGARFLLDPLMENLGENNKANELDLLLKKVRGDLRAMTGELQLPHFESGFAEELHLFCSVFAERHPTIRIIENITPEVKPLTLIAQQNLFRLFRTAMANVAKHANATEVEIIFVTREDVVTLKIIDNGAGFTVPDDLGSLVENKHYGLFLMQSYAASIKAKCSILSKPGLGTEVGVVV